MNQEKSDIQAAIELGKSIGEQGKVNGVPMVITPEGFETNFYPEIEPELFRVEEVRVLKTVDSFIKYVNEFKTENAVIFIDDENNSFTAIFDYHAVDDDGNNHPDHCKFKAIYQCPNSDEFSEWLRHDKQKMDQWDFAQFIEANIADIIQPSGAEMLSCALALEATKSVDFKSNIRLSDGLVQFKYEEDNKAGELKIPEEFSIGLPVFKKGESYMIKAKLRYRINDGKLRMWYELMKPQKSIDDAFDGVKGNVEENIELPSYI